MLDDNDQQNNRIDDIVNDVTVRVLRGVCVCCAAACGLRAARVMRLLTNVLYEDSVEVGLCWWCDVMLLTLHCPACSCTLRPAYVRASCVFFHALWFALHLLSFFFLHPYPTTMKNPFQIKQHFSQIFRPPTSPSYHPAIAGIRY